MSEVNKGMNNIGGMTWIKLNEKGINAVREWSEWKKWKVWERWANAQKWKRRKYCEEWKEGKEGGEGQEWNWWKNGHEWNKSSKYIKMMRPQKMSDRTRGAMKFIERYINDMNVMYGVKAVGDMKWMELMICHEIVWTSQASKSKNCN